MGLMSELHSYSDICGTSRPSADSEKGPRRKVAHIKTPETKPASIAEIYKIGEEGEAVTPEEIRDIRAGQ